MSSKIRRVDFSPDEWLAGTAELSEFDRGVYITVCALIYSRGGRIGEELLKRHSRAHGNAINSSLLRLEGAGKIVRNGLEIGQKRAEKELETARKRLGNASENGKLGNQIKRLRAATRAGNGHANHHYQPSLPTIKTTNARAARSAFADFWQAYPHKVAKGAAEKACAIALRTVSCEQLLDGVRRYIAAKPPDRPWCNPATWLTQRRWEDDPSPPQGGSLDVFTTPRSPPPTVEEVRARYAALASDPLQRGQD
jgi:uncharacterized protein YdaU (DUF1376 family)